MLAKLRPYSKAIVAFIAPGAAVLAVAVTSGSDGGTAVTLAEGITAACTCVITSGAVYAAPRNRPA